MPGLFCCTDESAGRQLEAKNPHPTDARVLKRYANSGALRSMQDYTSKLRGIIVILYEMDGLDTVEAYAKEHGIPVYVCRRFIVEYEAAKGSDVAAGHPRLLGPWRPFL